MVCCWSPALPKPRNPVTLQFRVSYGLRKKDAHWSFRGVLLYLSLIGLL